MSADDGQPPDAAAPRGANGPPQPRLEDGPLAIRPTAGDDLPFVLAVEAHPDNAPYIEQWSAAEHRRCIEGPACLHWIIEEAGTRRPLGYIVLEGADDPARSLLLRRIAMARKGRGYGRAAIGLVARFCFEVLGFCRLWLCVLPDNRPAYNLYRKLGFTDEGLRPAGAGGERMRVMALTAERYHEAPERFRTPRGRHSRGGQS